MTRDGCGGPMQNQTLPKVKTSLLMWKVKNFISHTRLWPHNGCCLLQHLCESHEPPTVSREHIPPSHLFEVFPEYNTQRPQVSWHFLQLLFCIYAQNNSKTGLWPWLILAVTRCLLKIQSFLGGGSQEHSLRKAWECGLVQYMIYCWKYIVKQDCWVVWQFCSQLCLLWYLQYIVRSPGASLCSLKKQNKQ